jgi:F420-0:gamma-glutamyl ligase
MIVTSVKSPLVEAGKLTIEQLLDKSLGSLTEGSVLAVTSKVVSLCENRIVDATEDEKIDLVKQEADYYLTKTISKYNYMFTIARKTLIANSGIDESNVGGGFLLWPDDPQKSANKIRDYLVKRFSLKKVGVIITDSSVYPMRWGTVVIPIGHSGFLAKTDYRGKPDLFGRPFKVSTASVAGGLSAAAGVVMGEGTERTPFAVITEIPFVKFQDRNPTDEEIDEFYIPLLKDDLFAPFLQKQDWKPGGRHTK